MFKIRPKTLVLGGLALAAAAGALKNRDKVAGLIGARSSAPEPPRPEPAPAPRSGGDPAAPAPSNYDLGGPAANTATRVPAPEAAVLDQNGGVDERAEEQAAAAEAAAIGGSVPEYPGLEADAAADDASRPLMEAGEGESEGEELAEFDLRDEAELGSGETSDAERQVDETIAAQANPALGESIEALETNAPDAASQTDRLNAGTADDADDAPTSASKDDDDPSNDGVREMSGVRQRPDFGSSAESPGPNGSGGESQSAFGFAGGKVGGEEDPAPGLPNTEAVQAAEGAAESQAAPGTPDTGAVQAAEGAAESQAAPGTPDTGAVQAGEYQAAPGLPGTEAGEDAAEDQVPQVHPDQTSLLEGEEPPREKPAAEKSSAVWEPSAPPEKGSDEGGSEWQTWSGRAEK